jgi:hypothetical protein
MNKRQDAGTIMAVDGSWLIASTLSDCSPLEIPLSSDSRQKSLAANYFSHRWVQIGIFDQMNRMDEVQGKTERIDWMGVVRVILFIVILRFKLKTRGSREGHEAARRKKHSSWVKRFQTFSLRAASWPSRDIPLSKRCTGFNLPDVRPPGPF